MTGDAPRVAGVELGGTKSIAVIARGREIVDEARWRTTTPDATPDALLTAIGDWIAARVADAPVAALGIASFGPLGLDPARADFGFVTDTPKPGWSGIDVRGILARRFAGPIGFDTDVAGAALAEGRWGASIGCDVHVYLTVGTGVGAGIVVGGKPVHGRVHPELGHLRVRRSPSDAFAGHCPFHGDCLEGLVSGPAIAARAGTPAERLASDDPLWGRVADELAELTAFLILGLSPRRIVVGGGVAQDRPALLSRIRARALALLGGYVSDLDAAAMDRMIVMPGLGANAGPLGAVALALDALGAGADSLSSRHPVGR